MSISRVSSLVTTKWLKDNLVSRAASAVKGPSSLSQLCVLDASWLPEPNSDGYSQFYSQGHIPTASFLDLKKLSPKRPDSPIDCPIPDSNFFQDYVENLGITNNTHIVVYDQLNSRGSVRSWFLFRLFGHDKISVLNGGMKQWVKDGYEVTKDEPTVKRLSSFKVNFRPELLLDYKSMLKVVNSQSSTIVDSRPEVGGFYLSEDGSTGGHMPGAKSIQFERFFNNDGTFKSEKDLKSLFSEAGVDISKPFVATCQRGMTACSIALAGHLLGKEDVPLYNGSWFEWSAVADPKNIVRMKKP